MTVVNVTTAYPSRAVYVLGGSPRGIKPEYRTLLAQGEDIDQVLDQGQGDNQ
jgi:hypothetical protein